MPRESLPSGLSGFCVAKNDLRRWMWDQRDSAAISNLGSDQVAMRIDKFAFTANNVTYARLGEQIGYWRFFPAPEGWGYVPVWGVGEVTHSRHPEVPEGRAGIRVFSDGDAYCYAAERGPWTPFRRRRRASQGIALGLQRVCSDRPGFELRPSS
jgi:hypothetical protein